MVSVESVKAKVQRMLTDSFGSVRVDKDGDFFVTSGSAILFISAQEFVLDTVIVTIRAFVLSGFKATPDVYKWVATKGQESWFGSYAVMDEGDTHLIVLSHALLANHIDQPELENAVLVLGYLADKHDDELQSLFGGKRFTD